VDLIRRRIVELWYFFYCFADISINLVELSIDNAYYTLYGIRYTVYGIRYQSTAHQEGDFAHLSQLLSHCCAADKIEDGRHNLAYFQ
jgi:hypothetical protein